MLAAVMTSETAFAAALICGGVRRDFERGRRVLIVTTVDRVTGAAVIVDVSDMGFVREQRAKSLARSAKHRNVIASLLCVTNDAAGFWRSLFIGAVRRMANVTFWMRSHAERRGLRRLLVAEIAIGLFAIRQTVLAVSLMLFSVKENVEIVSARKIALRRSGG